MKRPRKAPVSNKIKRAPFARTRHVTVSPISRLRLHLCEFQAADEIMAAFQMAAGLPVQRDPDLGIPLLPRPDAADDHAARRSDIGKVYPTWRTDLRDTVELRVADAVLFQETPLSQVDAENHWRKGTARIHLDTALKHFAALRGNAPRGERGNWKFTTAQPHPHQSKGKSRETQR